MTRTLERDDSPKRKGGVGKRRGWWTEKEEDSNVDEERDDDEHVETPEMEAEEYEAGQGAKTREDNTKQEARRNDSGKDRWEGGRGMKILDS